MAEYNISDEELSELLNGLDDDVEVPEAARKAWRGAIKREARRNKTQHTVRRLATLAAAVVVLLGGVLLFRNSGILATTGEKQAAQVYRLNSAESAVVMLEADGEADSSAAAAIDSSAAGETERMITGVCKFGAAGVDEARAAIDSAISGIDAYTESVTEEKLSITEVIRVRNEDVDRFIANLRNAYPELKAEIKYVVPDESAYDLDSRLNAAYDAVNVLKAGLSSSDASGVSDIYAQLEALYADIDTLESLSKAHANDLKYAHITVSASVNALFPRIGNAFSGLLNGFGSDAVITIVLLLPVVAILAACILIVKKKFRS